MTMFIGTQCQKCKNYFQFNILKGNEIDSCPYCNNCFETPSVTKDCHCQSCEDQRLYEGDKSCERMFKKF